MASIKKNSDWSATLVTWWQTYNVSSSGTVTNSSWQSWTFKWNTFVPSTSSSSTSWSGTSGWWSGWSGWSGWSTTTTPSWSKTNYNLTWERYTDWNEVANWASPDIAWTSKPNNTTWWTNDPTWWKPQSAYSWWGGGWSIWWNWNGNWEQQNYPQYPQKDYPDYSWQFDSIKNYINNLESSVTWDISWLRNLMNENNTMFQSKLDAQLQAQRELENKFNEEWSKIEWKMDENTRAQKDRLDQMEQKYTESLNKTQEMLEEYYSSTREVLERRASSATAAAASELWAKWLNSAVVENSAEGKRLQMQDAINQQIKLNSEMQQQLNNDYADFMANLVNQHNTLDQNQINFLKEWLNKKQELWNASNQYVQDYINNVYKPAEDYYNTMFDEYNSQAKTDYSRVLSDESYAKANVDQREATLFNRLTAMLEQYWDISALSDFDWQLISKYANDRSISQTKALTLILQWVLQEGKWQDSALYDAVYSYNNSRGTNTSNPTSNPSPTKTNNEPGYNDDSQNRLAQITSNLEKYAKSNPELFADRNKFNAFFKYNERSDTQKAVLDEYFKAFNNTTNTNKWQEKLVYVNPGTWAFDWFKALENIKNSWDTLAWKKTHTEDLIEVINHDRTILKNELKTLDKNSQEYKNKNKLLTQYDNLEIQAKEFLKSGTLWQKIWQLFTGWYKNDRAMIYNNIINNPYLTNAQKKQNLWETISTLRWKVKRNPNLTMYQDLIKELTDEYNKF